MSPTEKMIAAEAAWHKAEAALVERMDMGDPTVDDSTFEEAAQQAAKDNGITWRWEWDDDMVPTWIDGDIAMWFNGRAWFPSHHHTKA